MTATIVGMVAMVLVLYGLYRIITLPFRGRGKISADGLHICPHCGTRGEPKMHAKGSIWIEIVLWLLIIVPGLIYSIWRLTTKEPVCPSCEMPGMIAVGSPRGKQLVAQFAERQTPRDEAAVTPK